MEAGVYSYTIADKLIEEAEEKAKQEAKEAEKKKQEEEKKKQEEQGNQSQTFNISLSKSSLLNSKRFENSLLNTTFPSFILQPDSTTSSDTL